MKSDNKIRSINLIFYTPGYELQITAINDGRKKGRVPNPKLKAN